MGEAGYLGRGHPCCVRYKELWVWPTATGPVRSAQYVVSLWPEDFMDMWVSFLSEGLIVNSVDCCSSAWCLLWRHLCEGGKGALEPRGISVEGSWPGRGGHIAGTP